MPLEGNSRGTGSVNVVAEAFFRRVDLGRSRTKIPEQIRFLCGGTTDASAKHFTSVRDYIIKKADDLLGGVKHVLAEVIADDFDQRLYDDLISLETDVANISSAIVLVCESPGSIAELGAFSQVPDISSKLLAFVERTLYQKKSFIRDGPVRYLENQNEDSAQELPWSVNKKSRIDPSISSQDESIRTSIASFVRRQPRTQQFAVTNRGHIILLICGIIHTLRVCKLREISAALDQLQQSNPAAVTPDNSSI